MSLDVHQALDAAQRLARTKGVDVFQSKGNDMFQSKGKFDMFQSKGFDILQSKGFVSNPQHISVGSRKQFAATYLSWVS